MVSCWLYNIVNITFRFRSTVEAKSTKSQNIKTNLLTCRWVRKTTSSKVSCSFPAHLQIINVKRLQQHRPRPKSSPRSNPVTLSIIIIDWHRQKWLIQQFQLWHRQVAVTVLVATAPPAPVRWNHSHCQSNSSSSSSSRRQIAKRWKKRKRWKSLRTDRAASAVAYATLASVSRFVTLT